jgi:hypothetical protein
MSAPRAKGTGTIFRPKGSRFYWIAYVSGGKRRFEGTKSERKKGRAGPAHVAAR